jgi:hypothetical protein
VIRRLVVLTAVAAAGVAGLAAPAGALGPRTPRASSDYIACVYDGAPLHVGLCISLPV